MTPGRAQAVVAIDAGNSALKVARVTADEVGPVERLPLPGRGVAPGLEDVVEAIDRAGGRGGRLALSSVVPAAIAAVRAAARSLDVTLIEAGPATIPMRTAVTRPDELGADRLLGAWAARERHGAPVIVLDLGTAITVDVVDGTGMFQGGAILAGPALALAALADATALLPEVDLGLPATAIGRSTVDSLRAGAVLGALGAVRELVLRSAAELGLDRRPAVVATGGITAAGWMRGALLADSAAGPPIADVVDPDLLLRGLGRLATLASPVGA
jgi:type III pantothenate kinase